MRITALWCRSLFDAGVSRNVYCVNVDAVIAALLLKMLWQPYRAESSEPDLETAAFTIFLYPRMLGCAARSTTTEPRPQHGHPHGRLRSASFVA